MSATGRSLALLLTVLAGCAASELSVYPQYLGSEAPVPRPDTSRLALFLAGDSLPRAMERIGTVWVMFERGSTGLDRILDRVRPDVRKMGGDAVVLDSVRRVALVRREISTGREVRLRDPFGGGPFGPGRPVTVIVGAGEETESRALRWAVAFTVVAWKPRP